MARQNMTRREMLLSSSAALVGWPLLHSLPLECTFSAQPADEVIPWLDRPGENPVPDRVRNLLNWETLDSWITPNDQFFSVAHYGHPTIDAAKWRLQITGLVQRPMQMTLDDLKARPHEEVVFTIECSGNHGFNWNIGLIGNARWGGTALAPLLQEAGVTDGGREVVFYGADTGEETVRGKTIPQHFARSMSLEDAMDANLMLCYEMNGASLPRRRRPTRR